mmetsp:Transcript_40336/g.111097  ORF Transcript_40336/g.111097 Transcript_40336/m.111097 type:complete len:208 (+) Transcript_40336:1536-2159(+)
MCRRALRRRARLRQSVGQCRDVCQACDKRGRVARQGGATGAVAVAARHGGAAREWFAAGGPPHRRRPRLVCGPAVVFAGRLGPLERSLRRGQSLGLEVRRHRRLVREGGRARSGDGEAEDGGACAPPGEDSRRPGRPPEQYPPRPHHRDDDLRSCAVPRRHLRDELCHKVGLARDSGAALDTRLPLLLGPHRYVPCRDRDLDILLSA